jgi:hypothetical protein
MIASQSTYMPGYTAVEEPEEGLLLFSSIASKQSAPCSGCRPHERKIIPLSDEVSWIEGTITVAF